MMLYFPCTILEQLIVILVFFSQKIDPKINYVKKNKKIKTLQIYGKKPSQFIPPTAVFMLQ